VEEVTNEIENVYRTKRNRLKERRKIKLLFKFFKELVHTSAFKRDISRKNVIYGELSVHNKILAIGNRKNIDQFQLKQ